MQKHPEYGKLLTKDGDYWVCPRCGRNKKFLQPQMPDATASRITVYCRVCRQLVQVNIVQCQCYDASANS